MGGPAATSQLRRAAKSAKAGASLHDWDEEKEHPGPPPLPFNQWVVGSSPTRVTSRMPSCGKGNRGGSSQLLPPLLLFDHNPDHNRLVGNAEQSLHCVGGLALHLRVDVGVGVHRQRDLAVAERFHDHARRDALRDEQ